MFGRINKGPLQQGNGVPGHRVDLPDFFNLIANNGYLISMMNNSIPAVSQTSKVLTAYCSKILKKDLGNCSLFISQPQFAQNVNSKMDMFESTKGIDLMSGYSFYEYSIVGIQNTIQR
jgi:hypothetical protein